MILKIFDLIDKTSTQTSSFLMKRWYGYISKLDKKEKIMLLNYGYENGRKITSRKCYENNRYSIQLYYKIASSVQIKDKKILEVGCGRGGGAFYIAGYLKPKLIIGIDNSKSEINFDKKHYHKQNLKFQHGDAIDIPFQEGSFDIVINIESSHCYVDFEKFSEEVKRVLKPSGYFLFADFRKQELIKQLFGSINKSGLKVIKREEITKNVAKALDLDSERRKNLIKELLPKFLYKAAEQFAGVKRSEEHTSE